MSGGWHERFPQAAIDMVAQAAARLGLTLGRDGVWRGCCPVCSYAKQTLAMKPQGQHVALSCRACGRRAAIAATMGLPEELIVHFKANPSNAARAIEDWGKAAPAAGTMVEAYLRTRRIVIPIPAPFRFIGRRWNWRDGEGVSGHDFAGCARARRARQRCAGSREPA